MKTTQWMVIILILIGVIFLQRCNCNGGSTEPPKTDTTIVIDTVWKHFDTTVKKPVVIIKTIHDTLPVEYYPHPMYDSLKVQYEELAKDYLAKRIYSDTLKIPQLKGLFIVNDTVKNNKLMGRSWNADYIIPTVTKTITINNYPEPKRQFYVGGGLSANLSGLGIAQVGILYKDRKDKIFGGFVSVVPNGTLSYGVQSYWKIRLKK